MLTRILVSLDGTTFSERALPWAVSLSRRSGAPIHLATVEVPPPMAFPDVNFLTPLSDAELAYLDRVADRLRAAGVVDVEVSVLTGNAPEALEEYRRTIGADLTVMATHGRGPLARSWLGSVADHFARSTAASVLMVRPDDEDDGAVDLTALPEVERIVLTLDGSALSESAIEPAMALAETFGAAATLVRVVEYPNRTESVYLPDAIEAIEDRLEESRLATQEELARVMEGLVDAGVPVDQETRVVVHAAEGILDIARERDADLIAMASHGRRGVRRLILGSVTDKVLRGSDRPVLIVRTGS